MSPWYKDRAAVKLVAVGILIFVYAIAEFVVGSMTKSLALFADAFHMLADLLSLAVAFWAIRVGKKRRTATHTFGWIRAEIVGGLINGIFLLTVSLFIAMEAFQRFIEPPEVRNPLYVVITSAGGFVVNIIGLVILQGQGHNHSHSHEADHEKRDIEVVQLEDDHHDHGPNESHNHKKSNSGHQMNMKGVFLHILGDALGALAALVSGLLIMYVPFKEKYYADPVLSLVIAVILLKPTIPLVKKCISILMQSVPETINLAEIQKHLETVEGVFSIHEFHVWQLSDSKVIGTVHMTCNDTTPFISVAPKIKKILHSYGIHSATIQPEYLDPSSSPKDCVLQCKKTECKESLCCDDNSDQVVLETSLEISTRNQQPITIESHA